MSELANLQKTNEILRQAVRTNAEELAKEIRRRMDAEDALAGLKGERDALRKALESHLCPHDLADWLGCTGNHGEMRCHNCDAAGDHPHTFQVRAETAERSLERLKGERDAADAELRKHLKMNEGETLVGGIRNLAQVAVVNEDLEERAETAEAALSQAQQALRRILEVEFPKECTHGEEPEYCPGCEYEYYEKLSAAMKDARAALPSDAPEATK